MELPTRRVWTDWLYLLGWVLLIAEFMGLLFSVGR